MEVTFMHKQEWPGGPKYTFRLEDGSCAIVQITTTMMDKSQPDAMQAKAEKFLQERLQKGDGPDAMMDSLAALLVVVVLRRIAMPSLVAESSDGPNF